MADQLVVVPFISPSPAAQFDIATNAITETVTAVILVYSRAITDDSDRTHGLMGMGLYADDGTAQGATPEISICPNLLSGSTTERAQTAKDFTAIMFVPREGAVNAADIEYTVNSFISGGVRLDSGIATNAQVSGHAILFAGNARAFADGFSANITQQTEVVGGGGTEFQPDLVVIAGSDGAFGGPSYNNEGLFSLGFITPGGTKGHACTWENATDPTVSRGYVSSDSLPTFNTASTFQETALSIVSTGFQHQVTTGGLSSPDLMYLAIKFTDESLSIVATNLTAPSGTGAQAYSLGFQPTLVLGMSSLQVVEDSLSNSALPAAAGFFAFDSSEQRAISIRRDQGVSSAAASTRTGDYGLLNLNDAGAVAQQATRTLTASGFSLNFTTATSGLFTVLAIGGGSLDPQVYSEGVVIGDSVGFVTYLETTEGVVITDEDVVTVVARAVGAAPPLGAVAQAGAAKGSIVQAGPALGRVSG